MAKSGSIKSITIIGRRWFQKTYGNTYCSAEIILNGEPVEKVGPTYGYGDYYLQYAFEWLDKQKLLHPPRIQYPHGGAEAPWQWAKRAKVKLSHSVSDVRRERDL